MFGCGTIHQFNNNVSDMKNFAARDYEDLGLFTVPYTAYGRKALVSFGRGNIRTPYCQDENLTLSVSVRMSYGRLRSCTTVVESTKSILFMPDNDEVGTYSFNAALIATRSRRRRCFMIMRTRIVSGFRLERLKEIVSRPPEKMRSTATAEPISYHLTKRRLHIIRTYLELREYHAPNETSWGNPRAC